MLNLETFNVDELKDLRTASGTSKGNQTKWYSKSSKCWIKRDMLGYEGVAEYLATLVLQHSTLRPDEYVSYYPCYISEKGYTTNGCYSRDFTGDYHEVTLLKLFEHYNLDILSYIKTGSFEEKFYKVVDLVYKLTGLNITHALSRMLVIDALILNEDRHFNNVIFLYDELADSWRFAPIFDNGLSFLSDITDYPTYTPFNWYIQKLKSRPFSTSFKSQAKLYRGDPFINKATLLHHLDTKGYDLGRAETVLRIQINSGNFNHIFL